MAEHDLIERLGVLARYGDGWMREVNLVSQDGSTPVFDIRDWRPDRLKKSRGITLTKSELTALARGYDHWTRCGRSVKKAAEERPVYIQIGSVFNVTIHESISVLSVNRKSGWRKECTVSSWNDGDAKIDIREWSKDHSKMSRGITMTEEELDRLVRLFEKHAEAA